MYNNIKHKTINKETYKDNTKIKKNIATCYRHSYMNTILKKNKGLFFCMVVYTEYDVPSFIHQMEYFTSYLPFSGLEFVSSDSEEVSNSRPGIEN
jgi:hypothetical protein